MRALLAVLIPLLTTGCAPQSGNVAGAQDSQNQLMAEDSAQTIAKLYPAATTRIFLSQVSNDAYGTALEKRLRESGYAVQKNEGIDDWFAMISPAQSTPLPPSKPELTSSDATHQAVPVLPVTTGAQPIAEVTNVPVSYMIDHLDGGLYRLSITLDARQLSRVYAQSSKKFGAAGAWALRE
jgi:Conjugal transfer protein TrbH